MRTDISGIVGDKSGDAVYVSAMARLTTHVLDTASGQPAGGLRVTVRRAGDTAVLAEAVTDAQGRIAPLFEGAPGSYEITFHAGDYHRAGGAAAADPPFLDAIPVRVTLTDSDYHVPLLLSPFGYSVYRGS